LDLWIRPTISVVLPGPYERILRKSFQKSDTISYVDSSDSDSDVNVLSMSTKKKTCNAVFTGIGQRVKVRYDAGVWYKGTLINFNVFSGQIMEG
jgi:hypothetical protein